MKFLILEPTKSEEHYNYSPFRLVCFWFLIEICPQSFGLGSVALLQEAASFPCLYHGSPPPPLSVGKVGS